EADDDDRRKSHDRDGLAGDDQGHQRSLEDRDVDEQDRQGQTDDCAEGEPDGGAAKGEQRGAYEGLESAAARRVDRREGPRDVPDVGQVDVAELDQMERWRVIDPETGAEEGVVTPRIAGQPLGEFPDNDEHQQGDDEADDRTGTPGAGSRRGRSPRRS